MTRREIRKAAYKAIVKEGKSHQECFDSLKEDPKINIENLAKEVSKVPSTGKSEEFANLRNVYIVCLALVVVIRAISITQLTGALDGKALVFLILLGIIYPAYGIYAALVRKTETYNSMALIIGVNIIQSLAKTKNFDFNSIWVLIPFVAVTVIALVLSFKLKTNYKKEIVTIKDPEGNSINKTIYTFEDTRKSNEEILDTI